MKRDALNFKIKRDSRAAKFLWECRECHAVGLKPNVWETPAGKRLAYLGVYYRTTVAELKKYSELPLIEQGLCRSCAEQIAEPN